MTQILKLIMIISAAITLCIADENHNLVPVVQKPTDKPKDKPIMLHSSGVKTCYIPTFRFDGAYVGILNCNDQNAKPARYDVFQRISYNINNVWVCLSAPKNVTEGKDQWDYIHLTPCVINDKSQRWIVKNNAFYTADGKFRIKSTDWLYITKDTKDANDHTLDVSMKDWIDTIATPGNISIVSSIGWDLVTQSSMNRYYMGKNRSWDYYVSLYYNPDNGHIASYDPTTGSLFCMRSRITSTQDWNWVDWVSCDDTPSGRNNATFWGMDLMNKNGGVIKDFKGNALRVTRYGSNWGVPYTAKPAFLKSDTTHSPTSEFKVEKDLLDWIRYADGNVSKTLHYCPAPGISTQKRVKRDLPSDFSLNQDWIRRLYDIAVSTDGSAPIAGRCGVCLLHSYQMLGELGQYYPHSPLSSGGYFFNTAAGVNPFVSFSHRNSLLYDSLMDMTHWFGRPLLPGDNAFYRDMDIILASSISMLSQYDWTLTHRALNRQEIVTALTSLFNAPSGRAWIAVVVRRAPDGSINNHATPIIATQQGLVVIPTNTNMPFTAFTELIAPVNSAQALVDRLTRRSSGSYTLNGVALFAMRDFYTDSLDREISNHSCTGDGEDRRGSGLFPSAASVNQCVSGRCALSQ